MKIRSITGHGFTIAHFVQCQRIQVEKKEYYDLGAISSLGSYLLLEATDSQGMIWEGVFIPQNGHEDTLFLVQNRNSDTDLVTMAQRAAACSALSRCCNNNTDTEQREKMPWAV